MAGYADRLADFVDALGLDRPHVAGLSFGGALALEFFRRHPAVPATLTLVSATAGWAGSLPPGEVEHRLRSSLRLSVLAPEQVVDALLPMMFSARTPPEVVAAFGGAISRFRPVGFRAMARASAEDLRDALPLVTIPTLVVCGGKDVRAPRPVAEHLHAAIPGSALVVLPEAGHVCNLEQPEEFNAAVRRFLHQVDDPSPTPPTDPSRPGPRGAA
jgi:pimeloyl-ACP methyl ester carboxylesterase